MKNTTSHPNNPHILCRGKRSHGRLSLASVSFLFAILFLAPAQSQTTVYAEAEDGFLEARDGVPFPSEWPVVHSDTYGSWTGNMGEWYGPGLTVVVIPFQLPDVGLVSDPFTSASFEANIYQMGAATVTDIDLYGLERRAASTILPSDWYIGSETDTTPGTVLLQDGWLTPSTTLGRLSTSSDANTKLLSYLNNNYGGGAGAGEYVFLRGSYASPNMAAGWDAYNMTMREAGGAPNVDYPAITVTSPVPEPATVGLLGLGSLVLLGHLVRRRMTRD